MSLKRGLVLVGFVAVGTDFVGGFGVLGQNVPFQIATLGRGFAAGNAAVIAHVSKS